MANITQIANITTVTNTTTFVVVNNSSTKRVSYLTIKNQLLNETGKISLLKDVDASGITNGQVLKYSTSTNTWTPAFIVTGTNLLADLNDVSVGDRADGEVLTWSATIGQWAAAPSSSGALNDLSDILITGTPFDGQVLKYNTLQGKWINDTDNTGGTTYTLNTATGSVLGGVKIGTGISITPSGTISASASAYSRTEHVVMTSPLYNNDTANVTFTGYKSYALLKIYTNPAAWVRLYATSAARSSDSARAQTTDPTPGSGVIAEVITSGEQTVLMTPGVIGFNDDGTPSTTIYAAITKFGAGQQAVTVILTLVQLEA